MAVLVSSHTGLGFGAAVSKLFAKFNTWNETRKTRRILSSLSNRELEDIGLTRGDIEHMTF